MTPLIIAHRGGVWPDLPGEQTLPHFERAIEVGADLIEVDLHQTADGELICHHDDDLEGLVVAQSPYAQVADHARAQGLPPPPRLEELVACARGRIGLDLEFKVPGCEAKALAATRDFPGEVLYKSFQDEVVRRLRELSPDAQVGLLLGTSSPTRGALTRLGELFPGPRLSRCGASFVSPNLRLLRLWFLHRQRIGRRRPIAVWTVNEPEAQRWLLDAVDYIITDAPEAWLRARG